MPYKNSQTTDIKKSGILTGKVLAFAGISFLCGLMWGRGISPAGLYTSDGLQQYSAPQVPVGIYDEMAAVDIIRNNDDIWVVNHYTGYLIFEYNRHKEADKEAWQEYEDLLIEAGSKK
jgi:hypothetical protein